MKAARLTDYGSVENFEVVDVPAPTVSPGCVLVQVRYAGLRWSDILGLKNLSARRAVPTPFVPGAEAAGVVIDVGEGVHGISVGDRVVAQPRNGAYAELLDVPADRVVAIPDRVPLETALVYQVNLLPAYLMTFEWAKVSDGEIVVVHAAAGGVGSLAVQILRRRFSDVTIIGIVGSAEKASAALGHGADHAIDRRTSNYVEEVGRIVGPKQPFVPRAPATGVHVVLNGVGGPTLEKDPAIIRKHGRWVLFGTPAGARPIDVFRTIYDSITILPFSMMTFLGTPAGDRAEQFLRDWLATEELTAPTVHPIEDVVAVHAAMERGETAGKVVFRL